MYDTLWEKTQLNVVITGDSLSFNRYGYNTHTWGDAFECPAGMPSWSFRLRERMYRSDPQFVEASRIAFYCRSLKGLCPADSSAAYMALFDGNVQTLLPEGNVQFAVPVFGEQVVLYLQRRSDSPCQFDVAVDGKILLKDLDTTGYPKNHMGYGPMAVALPCDPKKTEHSIAFVNIRGREPKITVAGIGALHKNIVLTGRGSTCTDYFADHFEERIGNYRPDLLLLSLGANDRSSRTPEQLRENLTRLFSMTFTRVPHCKVLFLLPPSSHDPEAPESNALPYTGLAKAELYNAVIEKVCQQFAVDTLPIASLFDNEPVRRWRFDNIHLNPKGNLVLHDAVSQRLGLPAYAIFDGKEDTYA